MIPTTSKPRFFIFISFIAFLDSFINAENKYENEIETDIVSDKLNKSKPIDDIPTPQNFELLPLAITSHAYYTTLSRPIMNGEEKLFHTNSFENLVCACPRKERINRSQESPNRQILEPLSKVREGKTCFKNCQEEVLPYYKYVDKPCGQSGGSIVEIGYEIDFGLNFALRQVAKLFSSIKTWKTHFLRLITICYDVIDKTIIFIRHKIRSPKFFSHEEPTPTEIFYQVINESMTEFYLEENQKNTFKKLFPNNFENYFVGPSDETEKQKRYFVEYPLVHHEDMVLLNWKKSTFYQALTIPLWNTLTNNLNQINLFIHFMAQKINQEPIIYSGTYDTLRISGVPITLQISDNRELSVPKTIWKVVYLKNCKMGIAIITQNDIDNNSILSEQKFCQLHSQKEIEHIPNTYYCQLDDEVLKKIELEHLDIKDLLNLNKLLHDSQYKKKHCTNDEETNEQFDEDGESEDDMWSDMLKDSNESSLSDDTEFDDSSKTKKDTL